MSTDRIDVEKQSAIFRNIEEFRKEYFPSATAQEKADTNNDPDVDARLLASKVLSAICDAQGMQ